MESLRSCRVSVLVGCLIFAHLISVVVCPGIIHRGSAKNDETEIRYESEIIYPRLIHYQLNPTLQWVELHPHSDVSSSLPLIHLTNRQYQWCGVKDDTGIVPPVWSGRGRRSALEFTVRTLVVMDSKALSFHGPDHDTEAYIMSIMNIVANLFHHPSIGNAINIEVSRIILLREDPPGLIISERAEETLDSFCEWQNTLNSRNITDDYIEYDNAVLITRYDICSEQDRPCGTMGLAPVGAMCQRSRSCSVNEDIGLATAFTIAHEIGHNFGMQHDGSGNPCNSKRHRQSSAKLMSSQLSRKSASFEWSECSRNYVTTFLESGQGDCLLSGKNNRPNIDKPSEQYPGSLYTLDEQCQLQHGPESRHCHYGEQCKELWCYDIYKRCVANGVPPPDGTSCKTDNIAVGWCVSGGCVSYGYHPQLVDGEWGKWSDTGPCSRSCGIGVSESNRHCDNPTPLYGGKFCVGDRVRYKTCNTEDCSTGDTQENFRDTQCSKYNSESFRGSKYKWVSFTSPHVSPCALLCMADGYNFYTERSAKVIDGTSCSIEGRRHICVNGKCMALGCDLSLQSDSVEDRCRKCGGNNSSCETVKGSLVGPHPRGLYTEVAVIPRGAVHINVTEMRESRNYLALRNSDGKYFINGEWTINWPRQFEVSGTVFNYRRPLGGPESIDALGPTDDVLTAMVLIQEDETQIEFQYNIPKISSAEKIDEKSSNYSWHYDMESWSGCSVSCGGGLTVSDVSCMRSEDRIIVNDKMCNTERPNRKIKHCNTEPCPPVWVEGVWGECSAVCGSGVKTRSVTCSRLTNTTSNSLTDLPDDHCLDTKPVSVQTCNTDPCPPVWMSTPWSKCDRQCGAGMQYRDVQCVTNDHVTILSSDNCAALDKPTNQQQCHIGDCLLLVHGIEECWDVNRVNYCRLVLKFLFCSREYFRRMCCQTCRDGTI